MATEVDFQRLVVQLEASFLKYDRAWSKAMGQTDANVKQVKNRFDDMAKSVNNAGGGAGRGMQALSFQTSNVAAQFQDIAVQLAQPGTSPFLIAMQQGTQLSAVLNQSKSPIAALSAAFLQMINPISIATIATIALGGAAVQYLGTLLGDGKSATEVIKEQNDVIRRVAENWGEAVPALKAYVDQLDRAAQRADIEQATQFFVAEQYDQARQALGDIDAAIQEVTTNLYQMGATSQEVEPLVAAFRELQQRINQNSGEAADAEAVIDALTEAMGGRGVAGADALAASLAVVANVLTSVSRNALQAQQDLAAVNGARIRGNAREAFNNREFIAEQERLNGLTSEQLALENEIARVKTEAGRDDTLISEQQALDIARARLAADERRSQITSTGRSAGKTEDRERQAVIDLIAALEHEYQLLGLTEQQKAVANALRQAGAAATDAERLAIENLVNATYDEAAALDATNERMREFNDAGRQALEGFIQDMIAGKDATEALNNALANVGSRLISMGLDTLFGGGAGGGNGLFGDLFGGFRAAGGPVQSGKSYIVGEKGPELFSPKMSGMITPNDRLGGNSASFTFAPTIDARGADIAAVARLESMVAKQGAEFDGRVKQIVRGKGTKWR